MKTKGCKKRSILYCHDWREKMRWSSLFFRKAYLLKKTANSFNEVSHCTAHHQPKNTHLKSSFFYERLFKCEDEMSLLNESSSRRHPNERWAEFIYFFLSCSIFFYYKTSHVLLWCKGWVVVNKSLQKGRWYPFLCSFFFKAASASVKFIKAKKWW